MLVNWKSRKVILHVIFQILFINLLISSVAYADKEPDAYIQLHAINLETHSPVDLYTINLIYTFKEPYSNENLTYNINKNEESRIPIGFPPSDISYNLTIIIIREGFFNSSWTVPSLEKGEILNHTFYLEPIPPTSLIIIVKDVHNNSIENAILNLNSLNGEENFSCRTDINGVFNFEAKLVNYGIKVQAEGYDDAYETITVDHNQSKMNYTVTLSEIPPIYNRMVYLTIKDSDGNAINNATVNIRTRYSEHINLTNQTDESGLVVFELASNDYDIIVSVKGIGAEKFGLWIGNKGSSYEGALQMGVGYGEIIEGSPATVSQVLDFTSVVIIFVIAIIVIVGFLLFVLKGKKIKM